MTEDSIAKTMVGIASDLVDRFRGKGSLAVVHARDAQIGAALRAILALSPERAHDELCMLTGWLEASGRDSAGATPKGAS